MSSATTDSTRYRFMTILDLTMNQLVTGSSIDWTFGEANVPYSFALEMRGSSKNERNQNTHGFLLPADQIEPTTSELKAFVATLAKQIRSGNKKPKKPKCTSKKCQKKVKRRKNKRVFSYSRQTIFDQVADL